MKQPQCQALKSHNDATQAKQLNSFELYSKVTIAEQIS